MTAPNVSTRPPTWRVATVATIFGLFYAYAVWNAIGNLVQSSAAAGELGFSLSMLGWFVWVFAALWPILVWAGAFALGARRASGQFALILLVGLGLVAVFWLNVVSYVTLNTSALLV